MSTSNTPESIDLDELSSSGLESNLEWLRKTLQRRAKHIQDDELKRRAVRWINNPYRCQRAPSRTTSTTNSPRWKPSTGCMTTIALRTAKTRFQTPARAVRTTAGLSDYYVALATRGAGSNRRVGHGRHDVQKEIRGLATLHDCHRIPTWITQWETRYEGLVEEGWDIYLSIEIDVGLMDSPGAEMKVDLSADDDGGGY